MSIWSKTSNWQWLKFLIRVAILVCYPWTNFPAIKNNDNLNDGTDTNSTRQAPNTVATSDNSKDTSINIVVDPDKEKNNAIFCDQIKNPFVILIGIGTFDEKSVRKKYDVKDLNGVKVDMDNLQRLFENKYGEKNGNTTTNDNNNSNTLMYEQ